MIKNRPTITTTCSECLRQFEKDRRETDRQIRNGRKKFFCGRSCAAVANNRDYPGRRGESGAAILERLRSEGRCGRKYSKLSPFRYYIRKARLRTKHGAHDLDESYLKDVWDKQNERCAYSGIQLNLNDLYLRERTGVANDPRFLASLDRIDSSKGYIRGNVHFVSASLNLAKSTMTHEQFVEFIALIRATALPR